MKNNPPIPPLKGVTVSGRWKRSGSQSGFALIVVLCVLVLVTILSVGFLLRSRTEVTASTGFRASVQAQQLADRTVNLVQGQINAASTRGSKVAWASQPGMIRTYDLTGKLLNAYKLYSAPDMITSTAGITNGVSSDTPPATWADNPSLWVDLNAPSNGVYPILDPRSLGTSHTAQGFAIKDEAFEDAAMPVRWLYVLAEGQIVAPVAEDSDTVKVSEASKENPIVGRIAFWTDDDTCKVNINTASEGTYWDAPRLQSPQEEKLAKYQPAQKEFQRYSGHPATTSLSAVFPDLQPEDIYELTPRINDGGSMQGTAIATGPASLKSNRLYTAVDELIFQPDRNPNAVGLDKSRLEQAKFFLTARSRAPETNLFNLPRVATWPIFKFTNTMGGTNSDRTTAFDRLIAFCASTGAIGSPNYYSYIFQRENADSPVNDIGINRNEELYQYLLHLTGQEVPGFGGSFANKYAADRDQILTQIFDYIRSANLQDSLLGTTTTSKGRHFTDSLTTTSGVQYAPNGYGWVIPSQRVSGTSTTMGIGRYYTISELALVFICNADGDDVDDPATPGTDEALGSNDPEKNKVFAENEQPLAKGEKYIQAMILPEFFSPMQGFVAMAPDMQITIEGLSGLKVNGQSLFSPSDVNPPLSAKIQSRSSVHELLKIGGNPTYRFFGFAVGSPPRGNLPGDSGSTYPFFGVPIKIDASTGEMNFTSDGPLTVKLYGSSTGAPDAAKLIQTITINFPTETFPAPALARDGPNSNSGATNFPGITRGHNWWTFSKTGGMALTHETDSTKKLAGRLEMIGSRVFAFAGGGAYWQGAFIRPEYDTIRSVVPVHGDYRLIAASKEVGDDVFRPHRYYSDPTRRMAASLGYRGGSVMSETTLPGNDSAGTYISGVTYNKGAMPDIPSNATSTNSPETSGDFDNGIAHTGDGAFVNKPDEGDITTDLATRTPYFDTIGNDNLYGEVGVTFFSPNRQIPSPAMFGSLPSGVKAGVPWRTLLFRPQSNHFGFTAPRDHLLLDLFWMPVVEPYAISDRFSTAGKINMNYQIMPFTYIERSTGLWAVLKSEKVGVVPKSRSLLYTGDVTVTQAGNVTYRLPVNTSATLAQFQSKFEKGEIFKSATEICDIHIVPELDGATVSSMADPEGFWKENALTGDNLRERIYTTLYPRLTTKSNTYTVHFRAQSLRTIPSASPSKWKESEGIVTGEYRGSTSIERFINANDPNIPDYAGNNADIDNLRTLDTFYKWRVVENRLFAP